MGWNGYGKKMEIIGLFFGGVICREMKYIF